MYTLVRAVGLARSTGAQWAEVDIRSKLVYDVFNSFIALYMELSHPQLTSNIFVDIDVLRPEFGSFNDTIAAMLISFGDRSLPRVSGLPSTKVKFARYSDAFRARYNVNIADRTKQLPDNYPTEELNDLRITRTGYDTDMSLIHKRCLVTVNGFFHATDTDGSVAYAIDGAKSLRKSGCNQMGILSFDSVGALTKHHFLDSEISPQTADAPLKERIYLTVPNTINIENKSVFLVLGGYLIPPQDGVFWQTGDNSFGLDVKRLYLTERIHESNGYIDLSSLGLTPTSTNDQHFSESEIYSDKCIRAYLKLSQSFLVVVDRKYLKWKHLAVHSHGIPGKFTAYSNPTYPLVGPYGKMLDYWVTEEDGYYDVSVADNDYRRYVFQSMQKNLLDSTTDQLMPQVPYRRGVGHFLEIAGYDEPTALAD